jgi:hypothetical protein
VKVEVPFSADVWVLLGYVFPDIGKQLVDLVD